MAVRKKLIRPKCVAVTHEGKPCSNNATHGDLCDVHNRELQHLKHKRVLLSALSEIPKHQHGRRLGKVLADIKSAERTVFCDRMKAFVRLDNPVSKRNYPRLNRFFKHEDTSQKTTIKVHVRFQARGNTKEPGKNIHFLLPSWLAETLPYGDTIHSETETYDWIVALLLGADSDHIVSLEDPTYPVKWIKLYNQGEVPADDDIQMADIPVADGTQLVPAHPNLDYRKVTNTNTRDCLPRALVNHLKPSWDKDRSLGKSPLTVQTILDCAELPTPTMSVRQSTKNEYPSRPTMV